jgi:hypothetical protein
LSVTAGCSVLPNAAIPYTDVVRFDEDENPTVLQAEFCTECPSQVMTSPALWHIADNGTTAGVELPANPDSAVAGWMYFNLDNDPEGRQPGEIALQNWIVVSMESEGRYSVDFDAAALGNGCSPPAQWTDEDGDAPVIGPAPNVNP